MRYPIHRARHSRNGHDRHSDHGWISWADIVTCVLGAVCISTAAAAVDHHDNLVRALADVLVVTGSQAETASLTAVSTGGVIAVDISGQVTINGTRLAISILTADGSRDLDAALRPALLNSVNSKWLLVADERLPLGAVQRLEMSLQRMKATYSRVAVVPKDSAEPTR